MTDNNVRKLRPIFTGRSIVDGEEITLYKHVDRPEEIHISLANDELVMLSYGAEISTWNDPYKNEMRIDIVSPEWTGMAIGSKWETLEALPR